MSQGRVGLVSGCATCPSPQQFALAGDVVVHGRTWWCPCACICLALLRRGARNGRHYRCRGASSHVLRCGLDRRWHWWRVKWQCICCRRCGCLESVGRWQCEAAVWYSWRNGTNSDIRRVRCVEAGRIKPRWDEAPPFLGYVAGRAIPILNCHATVVLSPQSVSSCISTSRTGCRPCWVTLSKSCEVVEKVP